MIDHMVPKPIPFVRLGLANLPILVALSAFGWRGVMRLALLKIAGQGLITGMLFSYVFLFSAAGTLASAGVMYVVYRTAGGRISLVGTSVVGALVSNTVQLLLAAALVFGRGALLLAPPFLAVGLVTSIILGVVANRFVDRSRWLAMTGLRT